MELSNQEIRAQAREALRGNWLTFVIISLIMGAIVAVASRILDGYGSVITVFIAGPVSVGLASMYIRLYGDEKVKIEDVFFGFKEYVRNLVLELIIGIFIFLWCLLLIVPGIIAYYSYSMALFIATENPEKSAMDCIKESKELMKGKKGKLFSLHLSFFGWFLLGILTFGILFLWISPYVGAANAKFYLSIKKSEQPEAITPLEETFSQNNNSEGFKAL